MSVAAESNRSRDTGCQKCPALITASAQIRDLLVDFCVSTVATGVAEAEKSREYVRLAVHDQALPQGTKITVGGRAATYMGFHRKRVGANLHSIKFEDSQSSETLKLKGREWRPAAAHDRQMTDWWMALAYGRLLLATGHTEQARLVFINTLRACARLECVVIADGGFPSGEFRELKDDNPAETLEADDEIVLWLEFYLARTGAFPDNP